MGPSFVFFLSQELVRVIRAFSSPSALFEWGDIRSSSQFAGLWQEAGLDAVEGNRATSGP